MNIWQLCGGGATYFVGLIAFWEKGGGRERERERERREGEIERKKVKKRRG